MTSIRLGNNLVYRDGNIHQLSGRPGDSASSGNIIRKATAEQIAKFGSAGRGAGGGTKFINASDFRAPAVQPRPPLISPGPGFTPGGPPVPLEDLSRGNTYTFSGKTPNDGTYAVGSGPFPDLPAGTYKGNFFGNDPRLGLTSQNVERYSLPRDERDASSSGNTFAVGTGPQPNLPAGRFLPGQIADALRQKAADEAAAAAAAAPPPVPVTPVTVSSPTSTVPASPQGPSDLGPGLGFTPGAFPGTIGQPTFVPVQGPAGPVGPSGPVGNPLSPNFGAANLLASSTLPATGSTSPIVPDITSGLGSASVFSTLFPSIPDISQTTIPDTTFAEGGPVLGSDYLPGYQGGGEAEKALESEIITELNEIFVERGGMSPSQFYELVKGKSLPELVAIREAQKNADQSFSDRFPSLRGFSSPDASEENYYPPWEGENQLPEGAVPDVGPEPGIAPWPYDENFLREGPTELDYDMSLPERFQGPPYSFPPIQPDRFSPFLPGPSGERQAANGGPILASEYLNAGGPVQYFQSGGGVDPQGSDAESQAMGETVEEPALSSVDPGQAQANMDDIAIEMAINIDEGMTPAQAQAIANTALDQNISEGGIGSLSPGIGLGVNSEEGTATLEDIAALNAPGLPGSTVGYAINDPTGNTPGAITASQIAAQQNPSLANAMFAAAGLIGPFGSVLGTGAGAIEGRGMMQAMGLADSGRGAIADTITDLGQAVTGALTSPNEE